MSKHIAIVGATGAVGQELLAILAERGFPVASMRLFASERSVGRRVSFAGGEVEIGSMGDGAFDGVDIAFFSAGSGTSRELGPRAASAGALVIDNSSAFRMDPGVPLVVPEVNPEDLAGVRGSGSGIVANPNCSTIIMLVATDPLRRAFGVERLQVATYQAVSGAGAAAMSELDSQTRAVLAGDEAEPEVLHEPCAFNVFSHDTAIDPETGRNVEEQKMIDETRKMWHDPSVVVNPTCVRVPVMRAHTEAIHVTLGEAATESAVREALSSGAGLSIRDDRGANDFPTPLKAAGRDDVEVGRIRPDASSEEGGGRYRAFDLLACGDQIRKGAALNAIQIAEALI